MMALLKDKFPENTKGRFYVDTQCIDCDVCREIAPEHFTRNDENGYSYVHNQPETATEIKRCTKAMESCRVGAIGDDGKS
jgi:ferredoxin